MTALDPQRPVGQREGTTMSLTQLGLAVGIVLGLAGAFGGFSAFAIVVLFGALGLVVGRVLDGRLNLRALLNPGDSR